jgi:hypothetical protein
VARDRLTGFLFYYPGTSWAQVQLPGARIYAGGRDPSGERSMKILWLAPAHLRTHWLLVSGRRLDGTGFFRQGFRGSGFFPSIVDVPAPGCWQLNVAAGSGHWTLTVLAT